MVGLDVASPEFKVTDKNVYNLYFKTPAETRDSFKILTGDELIAFYKEFI